MAKVLLRLKYSDRETTIIDISNVNDLGALTRNGKRPLRASMLLVGKDICNLPLEPIRTVIYRRILQAIDAVYGQLEIDVEIAKALGIDAMKQLKIVENLK